MNINETSAFGPLIPGKINLRVICRRAARGEAHCLRFPPGRGNEIPRSGVIVTWNLHCFWTDIWFPPPTTTSWPPTQGCLHKPGKYKSMVSSWNWDELRTCQICHPGQWKVNIFTRVWVTSNYQLMNEVAYRKLLFKVATKTCGMFTKCTTENYCFNDTDTLQGLHGRAIAESLG